MLNGSIFSTEEYLHTVHNIAYVINYSKVWKFHKYMSKEPYIQQYLFPRSRSQCFAMCAVRSGALISELAMTWMFVKYVYSHTKLYVDTYILLYYTYILFKVIKWNYLYIITNQNYDPSDHLMKASPHSFPCTNFIWAEKSLWWSFWLIAPIRIKRARTFLCP